MIVTLVGLVLVLTLTLYATFAGADFGAGVWVLVSGRGERGRRVRARINASVTPVWESNHVWLVFAMVLFWTAFPEASVEVWTADRLPLWGALLGIVLRGAAFAFLGPVEEPGRRRLLYAVFVTSSLVTPFCFGCVVGRVVAGTGERAWSSTFPLLVGALFVAVGAYLAAVYLVHEARDDPGVRGWFAVRAFVSGIVAGSFSLVGLFMLHRGDPDLAGRLLTGRGTPAVVLAAGCGVVVLARLAFARYRAVRPIAWVGVASVVWGWALAQYPVLVPATGRTLAEAAAPRQTLLALTVLAFVVLVLVGPAFALLFRLQGEQVLRDD